MNGGDTDTGGAQVNPSTTPINTPGPRPVDAVVPDNDSDADSATTLTISHDDQPSPTLSSLPSTDSATQPSEPTMRPIIPTPSSVSTSQSTPPATNAAPVSSLGTPSTQPSTPVVPPVGMQQPTATPIAPPVSTAQSADQLISQTFASSTSSSQPTISTPVAPLQPSQPTQPLAAPSFSSQPAMQFPAASISSSSDDIILGSPASSQKSKKGLIIGLILMVIIAVVIGVAFAFYGPQLHNTDNSKELADMQNLFNKYANYVLFEKDSSDQIQNFNYEKDFSIDENINNKSFIENAKALFEVFSESFMNSEYRQKADTSLTATIENYSFLVKKNNTQQIDQDKMFQIYMKDGYTAAIDYIEQYYNGDDQDNYLMDLFKKYDKEYTKAMVQEWKVYDDAGCRQGETLDQSCVISVPYSAIQEPAKEMGRAESSIKLLIYQTVKEIKKQVWVCRDVIYGGDDVDNINNKGESNENK